MTVAALGAVLGTGCGDDDDNGPPNGNPHQIVVTTAAELDLALTNSVAGDTIEVRGEFSSPTFTMTKGYLIPATRSPLRIIGIPRSSLRPEIVFPVGVQGITFEGHDGSSVANLDFRGGQDVIVMSNSNVTVFDLNIRNNTRDGVTALGDSDGTVDSCLFVSVGRFGVSTVSPEAELTITKNTIVDAGDCGLFIDSNATIENNNIIDALNIGIHCEPDRIPVLTCNNVFSSTNEDYDCPDVVDVLKSNFSVEPMFCEGSYTISDISPLVAAGALGCGPIGRFWIGCSPE